MKKQIDLLQFFRTAEFGTVKLGDSKQTIISELGHADTITSFSKNTLGLIYGTYEFTLKKDKLVYIQNDHFRLESPEEFEFSNNTIYIDTGFFKVKNKPTFKNVKDLIERENIPYSCIEYFERTVIQLSNEIILDFNDENWDFDTCTSTSYESLDEHPFIGFRYGCFF